MYPFNLTNGVSHRSSDVGEGRARVADTHRSAVRMAAKNFILFKEIGGSVGCLNLS